MTPVTGTLVLGIGNLLMGDEGVGVHVLRALEAEAWPSDVTLVDGGTGGFHLLSYLRDYRSIVLIDATTDGQLPGTVSVIRPKYTSDFPRSLTAHDIGLRDLIDATVLLGELPAIDLITISIDAIAPMVTTLSPQVAAAIPRVRALVLERVAGREVAHA